MKTEPTHLLKPAGSTVATLGRSTHRQGVVSMMPVRRADIAHCHTHWLHRLHVEVQAMSPGCTTQQRCSTSLHRMLQVRVRTTVTASGSAVSTPLRGCCFGRNGTESCCWHHHALQLLTLQRTTAAVRCRSCSVPSELAAQPVPVPTGGACCMRYRHHNALPQ